MAAPQDENRPEETDFEEATTSEPECVPASLLRASVSFPQHCRALFDILRQFGCAGHPFMYPTLLVGVHPI